MHKLYEIRELLMEELEGYAKKLSANGLTPQCLDELYKLIESVKGIDKIFMLNSEPDEEEDGYSRTGNSYKRNRMGQYSRNEWTITSNAMRPRYSRQDRREMTIGMLEDLKSRAPSDKALEAIDTVMAQLRLDA